MVIQARFRGTYTDGETARLYEVEVRLAAYEITIHAMPDEQLIAKWPVNTLSVDTSMRPITRVTSAVGGEAALQVDHPDFRDSFYQLTAGRTRREAGRGLRLAMLLGVVAAIVAAIWVSLDPVSRFIAHKIPFSWEQKLGDQYRDRFVKSECQHPELPEVLTSLRSRLQGKADLPVSFDIVVSKDSSVNAFALPGGVIILNSGLIRKAESADEVAGVLAHELQHVIQRHVTTSIVRSTILTAIWSFTIGDFSGVMVVDPHTLYQIVNLSFDRGAESEADREAMKMLDNAGISRDGFIHFFQRLQKDGPNIPAIISTHPANEDRIALLEKSKSSKKTKPALTDYDWNILRTACGVDPDGESDAEAAEP